MTVEATSPVLIEKARTAVTDGAGQYRIVDLRAGAYTVSFTLVGFSAVRREGIELTGSFTAVVNADLKVGALAETITVSGETPIVDTQSVRRQTTISGDLITAIPSARSYAGLMTLMPNTVVATGAASDVQVVPGMVVFGGAGGRSNEGRLQLDGISVGSAFNGGGVSAYIADVGNAQEVALTTSGGLGEAEVGGPSMNVVPKTGGNTVKGSVYLSGVTKGMIGSNYTDDLKARGLSTPGSNTKIWDFNGAVGGPIKKDRLWFFYTLRDEGSHQTVPSMFANLNAGDPTKWTYAPDPNRPAVQAASFRTDLAAPHRRRPRRATRSAFSGMSRCRAKAPRGRARRPRPAATRATTKSSPAAPRRRRRRPPRRPRPKLRRTAITGRASGRSRGSHRSTSRLLVEASVGNYASRYLGNTMPGSPAFDFIQVTEQCAAGCAANDNRAGLVYRGGTFAQGSSLAGVEQLARLAVVRRGQALDEIRLSGRIPDARQLPLHEQPVHDLPREQRQCRIRSTRSSITTRSSSASNTTRSTRRISGRWAGSHCRGRCGSIARRASSRRSTIGGVRFLPTVMSFPETKGVDAYKDLTPRGGVAIDLFGDGKTALKFNFGRYLEAAQNGGLFIASRPSSRISTTASRTWTDSNGNFRPDCDLLNNAAQTVAGGDFCGAVANTNFGKSVLDTTQDPALLSGWGVRSGDWQWGASVQQQIAPRVSVEVSYLRRWLLNFVVTDNLAIAAGDFDKFTISAPVDARLPDGGGYAIPGPLYNVNPSKASVRGQQLRHARYQLHPTEPDVECDRAQPERAAAERPRHSGRLQHEQHIVRLLRAPCGDSRADHPRLRTARPIRIATTARAGSRASRRSAPTRFRGSTRRSARPCAAIRAHCSRRTGRRQTRRSRRRLAGICRTTRQRPR